MEVESEMSRGDSCHNESVYYAPYMRECVCVRYPCVVCVCVCVVFYNTDYIYYRAALCPAVAGLA